MIEERLNWFQKLHSKEDAFGEYDVVTPEVLYQAFKARLMEEVRPAIKQTEMGDQFWTDSCLIDKNA